MSMTTEQLASARMYLSDPGSSAVQSIAFTNATGGSFTITYSGQTTGAIAYGAGANVVQNALCALSNVGVGNMTVVNTAPYTITFGGTLGNVAQAMFTVNATGLTGTSVTATVLEALAGGVEAFSDADLDALYSDASNNFFLAVCYGFRVLQSNAARFNDYTAGQTNEKKAQIYDHLAELATLYQEWAFAGSQVQIATLVPTPPRTRAFPRTVGVPATSLSTSPPYNLRWRRNGSGGNGW